MLAGPICSDPCWRHVRRSAYGVYRCRGEHRVYRNCDSDGIRRRVARSSARGSDGCFGGTHLCRTGQSACATLVSDWWQRHLSHCRGWDRIHSVIARACERIGSRRCDPGYVVAAVSAPSWRGCRTDRSYRRSRRHGSGLDFSSIACWYQRRHPDRRRDALPWAI